MTPLAGRIALVTGARTGLGAATALALARGGATVLASGRRPGDCAGLAETARAEGHSLQDFPIDVADLAAVPARIAAAVAAHDRIDILVNNAATIAPMAGLGDLDPLAFHQALAVNVSGPAALVAALWPHLDNARIINLVSGAANRPVRGWAAYCASKSALLMLTRSIALEGADRGIIAFAFAPGLVDTDMQAAIRTARLNEIADIPRDRLLPVDRPAAVIAWLAGGGADDLAGRYLDIREPGLLERLDAARGA